MFLTTRGEVTVYDCEPGPDGVWRPVRRREVPCAEALAADHEGIRILRELGEKVRRQRSRAAGTTVECRRQD